MEKVKYENNLDKEVRKRSIGGSDSACVMGANKYKSAVELWLEKIGRKEPVDLSENEFVKWGKILEPVVAKEFEVMTGKKVRRNNFVLYHPTIPYLSANLDREVVGEDAILEIKTTNAYNWKEWENEEIPAEYLFQVQHYLIVTGKPKGYIAVLIGGNKMVYKEIQRDEELIEMMLKKYAKFWECVETNTMPEIKDFSINSETLKVLYPESNSSLSVDLTKKDVLIEDIVLMKQNIKDLQKQLEELENELKLELGESEFGFSDTYKVSWKSQVSERIDSKKFKEELPELAKKYVKESNSRVLRITKLNKGE